jgi:hypothetical protein
MYLIPPNSMGTAPRQTTDGEVFKGRWPNKEGDLLPWSL